MSSRRRHTISKRDWSSDVCSSDLCGTSGSRELRRGRVPDERAARLQADGIGTNDASLSGAKSGAGQRTASAIEKTSGEAHAFRVSAADGDAGAGRNADQPQARVPALPRGRFGDEDSATAADPLEGRGNEPSRHEAE